MTDFIRVDLGAEIAPGVWEYQIDFPGTPSLRLCGRSRQPLLDACRQIKSMGGDTRQRAGLFRKGRAIPDLVCGVGWGADRTVEDNNSGIRFRKFQAFNKRVGIVDDVSTIDLRGL